MSRSSKVWRAGKQKEKKMFFFDVNLNFDRPYRVQYRPARTLLEDQRHCLRAILERVWHEGSADKANLEPPLLELSPQETGDQVLIGSP